ncbi:MAG: PAS domain-containing protein [Rhodopirellula sp. JB044]|uniref:PAS domain-containing protein n=1 Tax=Rhodopirellula sp. JB044 TaxID=3342844 RepID=UPI00370CB7CE
MNQNDRENLPIEGGDELTSRVCRTLLEMYMPPAILMTERRSLVETFGDVRQWLPPPDDHVGEDLCDRLAPIFRGPISASIRKAKRSGEAVRSAKVNCLTVVGHEPSGMAKQVSLLTRPVASNNGEMLFMVEFHSSDEQRIDSTLPQHSIPEYPRGDNEVSLEQDHGIGWEGKPTVPKLAPNSGGLQSSDNEKQLPGEESFVSNEQLRRVNEELTAVNKELLSDNAKQQRKIDELTELTNDMDNLLNSTDVDTIFLDRQLAIRKFTPGVAEKFHLMRQDIGRNLESFTSCLEDDDLMSELRHVLESETSFEREVNDRNGNVYLMRILPQFSQGSVEGVVLTLVDITGLKQAQTRLAELSEIVQQSADAIFRVDRHGLIRTWNDGAKKLYGRDESIIGAPLAELLPDSMHDDVGDIIGAMSVTAREQRLDTHTIIVDERKVHVAVSVSPVLNEKRQWVAASVVARDVTARVEAEIEIHESIERRDQFLAMLSHELRNPLGAIINAARLVQADGEMNLDEFGSGAIQDVDVSNSDVERQRKVAGSVIIRQSDQMSRLLDDLLDVSRITLGKIELQREVFDLRETIEEAVDAIGVQFSEAGVRFDFEQCDQQLYVDGDPVRLQQVVTNLLRNACKYTPRGGDVRLTVLCSRGEAVLRVRDTGVGIDHEMINSIFDMFVQVNSTLERSQGGIGLGLTLVEAVVTMHGGTIEAYSEGLGEGSEFRVSLPLTRKKPVVKTASPQENAIHRIAVVEDLPDAREMLAGVLRMKGYVVYEAGCGQSGLGLIQREVPDACLIDIGLPGLDGYEVARRLRRDPGTHELFLIALTGYGQESDRKAVRNAGFDQHLVKPLDLDELERVLCQQSV